MPKMKTKSGAKKRFRITGSGLVRYYASGRRHGMIKRTPKVRRQSRGGQIGAKVDRAMIMRFLPWGRA